MFRFRPLFERAKALTPPAWVKIWARRVGALGAVALVSYVLWKSGHSLDLSRLRTVPLLGALAASFVAWLGLAGGWTQLSPLPTRKSSMATWCRSQVLRYLPGAGWAQAARATTVRTTTAGKVTAVFAESAATVAVATAVGGALYGLDAGHMWWLGLGAPVGMAVAAAVLGPRLDLAPRRIFLAMASYGISWSAYAVAAVLTQEAVGAGHVPIVTIAGAGVLAWVFGFLTIITPGGMGVREVAYVALLAGTLPQGHLATAALLSRVTSVTAELTLLVLVLLGRRWMSAQRARAGVDTPTSTPSGSTPSGLAQGGPEPVLVETSAAADVSLSD